MEKIIIDTIEGLNRELDKLVKTGYTVTATCGADDNLFSYPCPGYGEEADNDLPVARIYFREELLLKINNLKTREIYNRILNNKPIEWTIQYVK